MFWAKSTGNSLAFLSPFLVVAHQYLYLKITIWIIINALKRFRNTICFIKYNNFFFSLVLNFKILIPRKVRLQHWICLHIRVNGLILSTLIILSIQFKQCITSRALVYTMIQNHIIELRNQEDQNPFTNEYLSTPSI